MKLPVLILILGLSVSLKAQSDTLTLLPDKKLAMHQKLKPYNYLKSLDYELKQGELKPTGGYIEDQLLATSVDGKDYYLRIAHIVLSNGREILDSGLFDRQSLLPVYHKSKQFNRTLHFEFTDKTVTGWITTDDKKENVSVPLASPLFDSYSEDLVIKAIPLKNNIAFRFPDFIYEAGGLVWQKGHVTKAKENTWGKNVWEVTYTDSKTQRQTTYWLNAKREIIQREYQFKGRIFIRKPSTDH